MPPLVHCEVRIRREIIRNILFDVCVPFWIGGGCVRIRHLICRTLLLARNKKHCTRRENKNYLLHSSWFPFSMRKDGRFQREGLLTLVQIPFPFAAGVIDIHYL